MIDLAVLDTAAAGRWTASYTRVPFKSRGRDRAGADCWGLARLAYRDELGLDLPKFDDGYTDAREIEIVAALIRGRKADLPMVRVLPDRDPARGAHRGDGYARLAAPRLRPFDLLEIKRMGELCHIGVWAGGGDFLHTEAGRGAGLSGLFEKDWARRLMAVWRHQDVIARTGWTV